VQERRYHHLPILTNPLERWYSLN